MASLGPHQLGNATKVESKQVNGKEVIEFKPRALNIVWGNDPRYWHVPEEDNEPAGLLQVCWLEVTGSAKADPKKDYEVIFNLSLTAEAFGWDGCPVYVMVKRGKEGKFASSKKYYLRSSEPQDFSSKLMKAVNQESKDEELYFGLYEVWSGKWKGGLKIHHVIVKESP